MKETLACDIQTTKHNSDVINTVNTKNNQEGGTAKSRLIRKECNLHKG